MELIAIFKLIKGVLLFLAAVGLLRLVNRDIEAVVVHWVTAFRMDPDGRYLRAFIAKVSNLNPHNLKVLTVGSFFYAGLLLTEGLGLWFEKAWAEYLTVVATGCFVPLELHAIFRHPTPIKGLILTLNLAIVGYLVWMIRRQKQA